MSRVGVTIRVNRAAAAALDKVADDLKSHGLDNIEIHRMLQMINGDIDAQSLDALRSVDGVASVRKDDVYKAM
ncbi:hypothetical protein ACQKKX_12890 [Neorhizobium sp. NPDC001467]|uniref:hypothetical protein n=1 Tax=Neorhizobium sp. NPDC001467 TaxID=3390595 RepID=UPI003CFC0612